MNGGQSSGLRSGLLLAILGAFLIMRTITKDSTQRTLADRLLGKPPGDASSTADPGGAVVHTSVQTGPLPTAAQQKKQIAHQGYVTDNATAAGTVKPLTAPRPKPGKPGIFAPHGIVPSPILNAIQDTYPGNW